jgi:hypothetical protein
MKIQKSFRGTFAQVLAASALVSFGALAHAEPGCPSGSCPSPAVQVAPPAASKTSVVVKAPVWFASRDASLRELLAQWAATAGWQEPVWRLKPEEDFTLGASFEHNGELTEALPALFEAFPPEFKLHVRTYAANRLIIVEQTP